MLTDAISLCVTLVFCLAVSGARAETKPLPYSLQRVFEYKREMAQTTDSFNTNVYFRYYISTEKRNPTLMMIPSMNSISKGHREYAGEALSKVTIKDNEIVASTRMLNVGTIPHNREAMPTLWRYMKPDVYGVTIFDEQILSPMNAHNKRLYKYAVTPITNERDRIDFRPKRRNTRLISGSAIVERETGRIVRMTIRGEYDMMSFSVEVLMGKQGTLSLLPKTCDMNATFHFAGNRIETSYRAVYDITGVIPDSISNHHDLKQMSLIRPDSLPDNFVSVYRDLIPADKTETQADKKESKRWDKVVWNILGDRAINRIKGNFGTRDQGMFKISPILNPLYLGYSERKGVTYKLKVRGSYGFSMNRDMTMSMNMGYSFRQGQLYFKLPLRYNFDKAKNGFAEIELGNGNRITSSDIVNIVKKEGSSTIDWESMNLDYFKDFYVKARCNYDLTRQWSVQPGITYHRRSAVDKSGFIVANRPATYHSLAPSMQVQYRMVNKGPIITTSYERGINTGKTDMEYDCLEMDVSWKRHFHSLKSLYMKCGWGFYFSKSKNSYFLDYDNFRENYIPDGWNDDWTGEFQLLNSNWYNASEYYARANVTYESPLMILSRMPYFGRLMEMERIYMNVLFVEHLHPYVEYGYGFTNRFFSMGLFVATRNKSFDGIGCRFGFELFRDW